MITRVVLVLMFAISGFMPMRLGHAEGATCSSYVFQEDAALAYESSPTLAGSPDLAPDSGSVTCAELPTLRDGGLWTDLAPESAVAATVDRVVDGDTIDVVIDGSGEIARVRLVVVNTPETSDECLGSEASSFVSSLLEPGEAVWLTSDARDVDPYDRLLRHVWYVEPDASIRLLEYELTRRGLAWAEDYGEHSAYYPYAAEGMRAAFVSGLGIWSQCPNVGNIEQYVDEAALTLSTVGMVPLGQSLTVTTPSGNCDPSYPTVCIAPAPPDLDCGDIPHRRFEVLPPDPHKFDRNQDGIGCES